MTRNLIIPSELQAFEAFFTVMGVSYEKYPKHHPDQMRLLVAQTYFCFDKEGKYLGAEGEETPIWEDRKDPMKHVLRGLKSGEVVSPNEQTGHDND
jgi:hypothetical protein